MFGAGRVRLVGLSYAAFWCVKISLDVIGYGKLGFDEVGLSLAG